MSLSQISSSKIHFHLFQLPHRTCTSLNSSSRYISAIPSASNAVKVSAFNVSIKICTLKMRTVSTFVEVAITPMKNRNSA